MELSKKLLDDACRAKNDYKFGRITKDEARLRIKPFEERFNEVSKREAKKAGVTPRLLNITSFLR